tara:strand:- start:126111 stop:126545 length:435 start_codon:yes stop_codon:yes gene_type:complete
MLFAKLRQLGANIGTILSKFGNILGAEHGNAGRKMVTVEQGLNNCIESGDKIDIALLIMENAIFGPDCFELGIGIAQNIEICKIVALGQVGHDTILSSSAHAEPRLMQKRKKDIAASDDGCIATAFCCPVCTGLAGLNKSNRLV